MHCTLRQSLRILLIVGTLNFASCTDDKATAPTAPVTPDPPLEPGVALNMTLLGTWDERNSYGDIWGYTDNSGNEYALLCVRPEGVSIIDINVSPPTEVGFINSIDRGTDAKDVKVLDHYAIVVKEHEPVQIVDISDVTNPVEVSQVVPDDTGAHNCVVDGNFLYVIGNHGEGGMEIFDLTDPANPVEIGQFQPYFYHDIAIRNDTIAAAAIRGEGVDLIDVSNKSAPQLIKNFNYPGSGPHNTEFSSDGRYVFVGDEVGSAGNHTRVFDITVPDSADLVADIIVDSSAIVHNCYRKDNYLFIAHYTEGLRVWDISNPEDPFEVGYYDTFEPDQFGFAGVWGVYPYFASGKIVVSDINSGLWVLTFNAP